MTEFEQHIKCEQRQLLCHSSDKSLPDLPFNGMNHSSCAWCLTALSAQIGYIVPQRYEVYHIGPGNNTNTSCN